MNITVLLYLLPCILFVSRNVTATQEIEEIDTDKTSSATTEISKVIDNKKGNETSRQKLTKIFLFVSNGNELKKQYEYLIPKLASLIQHESIFNPFRLISVVPYIMFSLNMVNSAINGMNTLSTFDLKGLNLEMVLRNPGCLKVIFLKDNVSGLVMDAMTVLAGGKASGIIDKIVDEVKVKAVENRNGVMGINGEILNSYLQNSKILNDLFPSNDLFNMGLNYINAYMDSFAKSESSEDTCSLTQNVFHGTLSDSVSTFFSFGQSKINKIIGDGLQMTGNTSNNTQCIAYNRITTFYLSKTPNAIFKYFAKANSISSQYTKYIPQLAAYFMPIGVGIQIFKFICLVTYFMILTKNDCIAPKIGKDKVEVHGLNTEKIIDTLNNKETMAKIFPNKDATDAGISIIKFLAGPEAILVEKFIETINNLTTEKKQDEKPKKLTISDIVQNTELFKKLIAMKKYADNTIPLYLGQNNSELKKEIQDENEYNQEEGYFDMLVQSSPVKPVSAENTKRKSRTNSLKESDQEEGYFDMLVQSSPVKPVSAENTKRKSRTNSLKESDHSHKDYNLKYKRKKSRKEHNLISSS